MTKTSTLKRWASTGLMLNEHHANPFTLGSVMNLEAAILARITKRIKIVLLGNPLPILDPLRVAEETGGNRYDLRRTAGVGFHPGDRQ